MILMARKYGYRELLGNVAGRRVLIWTCNTCARLCGIGGRENAEALASRLITDGVDVVGTVSSSACCLMSKSDRMASEAPEGYDLVLVLCCDAGTRNAKESTGADVLDPIWTFGPGYMGRDGVPRMMPTVDGDGPTLGEMCVPVRSDPSGGPCPDHPSEGPF